jgi:FKBP-type peptidyl-prolyl cis-trans isomerase
MSEDDKPRGEPAVKAKLPKALEIGRSDFTPHGIGGKSRAKPKPSAMTAAKAKQRRMAFMIGTIVVVLAAAGVTTFIVTRPEPTIAVTGAFGKKPHVAIPDKLAPLATLQSRAVTVGKGTKVADGDLAFVSIDGYVWSGKGSSRGLDALSTFKVGKPVQIPITDGVMPGLKKGLVGKTVGSRVLLQVPPKDGLGQAGAQVGVKDTDTLVLVVDIIGSYGKNAMASGTEQKLDDPKLPKVTPGEVGKAPSDLKMPKGDPPNKLVTKTLIQGTGAPLAKGQTVVAQYMGQLWRNGKVFDSSWKNGQLFPFELGGQGAIKGFTDGLTGQKVGSRVLLVIPPKDGYGKQGNGEIKGTDTMVFVVDIVGAQ